MLIRKSPEGTSLPSDSPKGLMFSIVLLKLEDQLESPHLNSAHWFSARIHCGKCAVWHASEDEDQGSTRASPCWTRIDGRLADYCWAATHTAGWQNGNREWERQWGGVTRQKKVGKGREKAWQERNWVSGVPVELILSPVSCHAARHGTLWFSSSSRDIAKSNRPIARLLSVLRERRTNLPRQQWLPEEHWILRQSFLVPWQPTLQEVQEWAVGLQSYITYLGVNPIEINGFKFWVDMHWVVP